MTKIEEVARAIGGTVWDTCSERMREQFRSMARAAIAAMREPTRDMAWCYELPHVGPDDLAEFYRHAIDAALAEDK